MASGQAITLWFLASGICCIAMLAWAAIVGLGMGKERALAVTLLILTAALAAMPTGLVTLRRSADFPYSITLFAGATLCLASAIVVLWRLRRVGELRRWADLAIASCLNLWLALGVALSPISTI